MMIACATLIGSRAKAAVRPTDILLKKSVMNPASAELRGAISALTKEK